MKFLFTPTPAAKELTDTEVAYERFVPRQFLQLLGRPSILDVQLGDNVEREMTLLFSDIRDFTALSESILPAENFRFINSYLSTMEPVVAKNRGIIDKYIGDGIMALFAGAADDGVQAGIDMLRQLEIYNQGRARAGYQRIRIGIGVNTGLVMMGTVGGHNRMDSTVIGDAVNLASRLEGLTKSYSTPLVISAHTLHALQSPQAYCIRFLDRVQFKGRYQVQSVYEVFDADRTELREAKIANRCTFERALAYFHVGRVDLAVPLLEKCALDLPIDAAVQVYLERCAEPRQNAPDSPIASIAKQLAWRDELSVGVSGIDAQHQRLLAIIAELAKSVMVKTAKTGTLLAQLAEVMSEHFADEEERMATVAYPFASQHCAQHATFRRLFVAMREEIEGGADPLYLLFRIQLLLVDWKINHIAKSDSHLGNFLARAGQS